ncbi:MAG: Flp pilus assembly protein CpaB [Acidobacteria bacterium]|nr:Flp pilus assembly protein CpaB [Acidobacteriota bacterium]
MAIATTGIFYGLFVGKLDATSTPQLSIVVAAKNLAPGTPLTASDVKAESWGGKALPKGAYADVEAVVGQTVFQAVSSGEPVLESSVASAKGGAGLAIPSGMRAVSTHVTDSTGVLEMLRVGHKVDVQVLSIKTERAVEPEIRAAMQDITVLAIHSAPDPASNGGPALPSVTLLVTPSESDALALADSTTRVRLALRNPTEQNKDPRPTLPLGAVLRGGSVK